MKIDFEFESQYGKFADALHLPDDHNLTDAEIEAMKQQRFDNWIAVITAPPPDNVNLESNVIFETSSAPIEESTPSLPLG